MCGGRGTRLDVSAEKPLVEIGGVPMVERVANALSASQVSTTYAVPSVHTPKTQERVIRLGIPVIETAGNSYVADLRSVLGRDRISTPVLTVAADLPLLAAPTIDSILTDYDQISTSAGQSVSLSITVPTVLKRSLGVSVDEQGGGDLSPSGVNVVGNGPETARISYDTRLAVNVNRRRDMKIAEEMLLSGGKENGS